MTDCDVSLWLLFVEMLRRTLSLMEAGPKKKLNWRGFVCSVCRVPRRPPSPRPRAAQSAGGWSFMWCCRLKPDLDTDTHLFSGGLMLRGIRLRHLITNFVQVKSDFTANRHNTDLDNKNRCCWVNNSEQNSVWWRCNTEVLISPWSRKWLYSNHPVEL